MSIDILSAIITLSGIVFISVSLVIVFLGKKVGEEGSPQQKIRVGRYIEFSTNSIITLILIATCFSIAPLALSYWKPDLSNCIDKNELDVANQEIKFLKTNWRPGPVKIHIMDSDKAYNVYNGMTADLGGSNAQEVLGILAPIKNIEFSSELVNPSWRDYDKLIQYNPDILVIHHSCFRIHFREIINGQEREEKENNYEELFLKFLRRVSSNTKIRFLIYSRKDEFKNSKLIISKYDGIAKNFSQVTI